MTPGWLVSAAHRSSGKTTVAIGLCAALRARGRIVQPFKKGPDYIDPTWLSLAAGRACRNLDPHLSSWREIETTLRRHADGANAVLVEGNLGLHDGTSLAGADSNAELARRLGLPVLLVLDARGTARGIVPIVLGQQAFDPRLRIGGVVLNRVGGARHEARLRQALERHTDVPVLGALYDDPALTIVERHLGLVPSRETARAASQVAALGDAVARSVDLARIEAMLPRCVDVEPVRRSPGAPAKAAAAAVRIGVARDEAFGFYYPDDLEALQAAGAVLVDVDTLRDATLRGVDALLVGGGFPEALAEKLEANATLRREIARRIDAGMPVYAECGGLMYLSRSIAWKGRRFEMVGAIPADAVMRESAVGRGYVRLQPTHAFPWPGATASSVAAHEFHHSTLVNLAPGLRYAWRVLRGHGIDGTHDGIVVRNVLASYAHLRSVGGNRWPAQFVAFAKSGCGARGAAVSTPAAVSIPAAASKPAAAPGPAMFEAHAP